MSTKNSFVLINLTPNQPKITGWELSAIRSHNAYRHSSKRVNLRSRGLIDEDSIVGRKRRANGHSHGHPFDTTDDVNLNLSETPRLVGDETFRSDPFDSYPVPANEAIAMAIDHYATIISPLYGSYLRKDSKHNISISNGCLDVILPSAITCAYFFHALIAVSRTIQLTAQGKPAWTDGVVIYHRGQALVGIKSALAEEKVLDDEVLPLAVMHMVSLDVSEPLSFLWIVSRAFSLSFTAPHLKTIIVQTLPQINSVNDVNSGDSVSPPPCSNTLKVSDGY